MPALSLRKLSKTYGNGVQALKGIDLDVETGDFFALLGPNGAGKTTAIGIVSSLVTKTSGQAQVFGHDIDTDLESAKTCLGIVPQEINFNQFEKVSTILLNQAGFYGIRRSVARVSVERWLRELQLWDKRDAISRTLSGGMKRRLMIARALIHAPRLLILDEPTAGVDIEIRRSMWDFLRRLNARGHHDHPDHALPRGSRDTLPQHRDHRRGPHHRARPHVARAAQAPDRGVRAQHARDDRCRAAAARLCRAADGRAHARGRGEQGTEPERHLRGAHLSRHRGALDAQQVESAGGTLHPAGRGTRGRGGARCDRRRTREPRGGRVRAGRARARARSTAGSVSPPSSSASSAASSASGARPWCRRQSPRRSIS